jgi:hypothetical protein
MTLLRTRPAVADEVAGDEKAGAGPLTGGSRATTIVAQALLPHACWRRADADAAEDGGATHNIIVCCDSG